MARRAVSERRRAAGCARARRPPCCQRRRGAGGSAGRPCGRAVRRPLPPLLRSAVCGGRIGRRRRAPAGLRCTPRYALRSALLPLLLSCGGSRLARRSAVAACVRAAAGRGAGCGLRAGARGLAASMPSLLRGGQARRRRRPAACSCCGRQRQRPCGLSLRLLLLLLPGGIGSIGTSWRGLYSRSRRAAALAARGGRCRGRRAARSRVPAFPAARLGCARCCARRPSAAARRALRCLGSRARLPARIPEASWSASIVSRVLGCAGCARCWAVLCWQC